MTRKEILEKIKSYGSKRLVNMKHSDERKKGTGLSPALKNKAGYVLKMAMHGFRQSWRAQTVTADSLTLLSSV